jgi:hypothetical protein
VKLFKRAEQVLFWRIGASERGEDIEKDVGE